jgi:hypothetical protein
MKPTAIQVHKSWLTRAALVLVVTGLADGLVGWFAPRPILWTVLIAASLPLSMIVFVVLPIVRDGRRSPSL